MAKSIKRLVFRAALAAVLVLVVGGVLFYLNLNRMVKRTVEQQTTSSLNLPTTVGAATLSVSGGRLRLDDLRIASPPGFSGEPLLVLAGTEIVSTYGGLRGEPVRLASVTFERPRLLVEGANNTLNFKAMVDRLPPPSPDPMRLVVGEVTVEGAVVVLRRVPGLRGPEVIVQVPAFTLRNVGSGAGSEGGATVKDVVLQLVTALAAHASESEDLPPELRAWLKGDVGAVVALLGAEAQRQIIRVVPGEAGRALASLLEPGATKSPAAFFGRLLRGFPTTSPAATQPAATQPTATRQSFRNPFGAFGAGKRPQTRGSEGARD